MTMQNAFTMVRPQGKTEAPAKAPRKTKPAQHVQNGVPQPREGTVGRKLWDLADAMLVDVPTAVVDELTIDDLKAILTEGGLISFTGDDAPDPSNLTITLGESSASTGS